MQGRSLHDAAVARARARGFTLIEMVVVLAMIGLLVTLAMPRYFRALETGRLKVQQQNIAALRDSIDKFFGDQGRYPDALDELVQRRYLRSVPLDPLTGKPDWSVIAPADSALGAVYDVASAAHPAAPSADAPAASGPAQVSAAATPAPGASEPSGDAHATQP